MVSGQETVSQCRDVGSILVGRLRSHMTDTGQLSPCIATTEAIVL